jgi:hypothetical protein
MHTGAPTAVLRRALTKAGLLLALSALHLTWVAARNAWRGDLLVRGAAAVDFSGRVV